MKPTFLLLLTLFISLNALGERNPGGNHWPFIGKEAEAFDSMMETAVFLDVPRRDLLNVVKGYRVSDSAPATSQARARVCYWQAWILFKENPDSAANLAERAMRLCDSAAYPYDHARFTLMNADIRRIRGDLASAYSSYKEQLAVMEKHNDFLWMGKALVCIGTIMQDLGEFHEAMEYYREAEGMFRKAGSDACMTKNRINLANIHFLLGRKDEAMALLAGLEENSFVVSDSIYLANVLVSRYHISEFTDSAAALKAYEISRTLNNDHLSVLTLLSMGMLRHLEGRDSEAADFLSASLSKAERLADFSDQRRILKGLEECHEARGKSDSAALCHMKLLEINDSLYRHERIEGLKKAEHLATINRYELRIRENAETSRWKMTLTISIAGAILVILALALWLLWISKRKAETSRQLEEEKNSRLELLNRQYSLELEAKQKELASNTILMVQKNAQLKELAAQLERMDKPTNTPDSLKETISRQLSKDDDWGFFKLRFDKMHPGFFDRVRELYPSLSRTELRLCAYIRVGMTSKEIAQVLSVKPDTVNTSRYRIRKKMGLSPEESMEAVLEKI